MALQYNLDRHFLIKNASQHLDSVVDSIALEKIETITWKDSEDEAWNVTGKINIAVIEQYTVSWVSINSDIQFRNYCIYHKGVKCRVSVQHGFHEKLRWLLLEAQRFKLRAELLNDFCEKAKEKILAEANKLGH